MFRCWDPGRGTCPRRDVGSRPSLLPRLLQQPYPLYTPAKVVPRQDPGGMTQVHISSSQDSPRYFVVVTESRNTSYFLAMFAAFSYRFIFHKQKQQQQKNGVRFTAFSSDQFLDFLMKSTVFCFLVYLDVYYSFPGAFHRSPLFLSPMVQWQAKFFLSSCLL